MLDAPTAPVRLTTLTFAQRQLSASATKVRAMVSVPPPADQGTIRVMSFSGNSASAGVAKAMLIAASVWYFRVVLPMPGLYCNRSNSPGRAQCVWFKKDKPMIIRLAVFSGHLPAESAAAFEAHVTKRMLPLISSFPGIS
ncbi:hypothetical protein [Sulfitobacter mediterraneus]|uniref:hypothetical protein n=1 Tax=Sulfitobacter mediterraneus TaxID=83219 RepID=UPI0013C4901F|nr:hypothetical protein [Sulfitobacter mediterraneus]